jgi:hypothetical protein
MGIEEGEEVQDKGICNIFNKLIKENFPSQESFVHLGTGILQNTKQILPK